MIYFGYGIHHSAEADAARRSSETEMIGFNHEDKSERVSPEEAFLHYAIDDREDEDGSL